MSRKTILGVPLIGLFLCYNIESIKKNLNAYKKIVQSITKTKITKNREMVEIPLKNIILCKMRTEKKTGKMTDIIIQGFLEYHIPKKYPTYLGIFLAY